MVAREGEKEAGRGRERERTSEILQLVVMTGPRRGVQEQVAEGSKG